MNDVISIPGIAIGIAIMVFFQVGRILSLIFPYAAVCAVDGFVSPERRCVCRGDEAVFFCIVEEPGGGDFTWRINSTTETCQLSSLVPFSQCGQFMAQLEGGSLSTLTATSDATRDTGNILIQCDYNANNIGNGTILKAG